MARRERLMATLAGKPVDRPAVNFYEVGGLLADPNDPSPYNVYNDPSWLPLLQLAEEKTDIIRMCGIWTGLAQDNPRGEYETVDSYEDNHSMFTNVSMKVGGRTLTTSTRRDRDVATVWTTEHLLKDTDDLRAYLQLPDEFYSFEVDVSNLLKAEAELGDKGIVMVDVGDPLCMAANLFPMEEYTIIALTEPELFHALLEKLSMHIYTIAEFAARECPSHLWRIYGPEFAAEPYLPPRLFEEYVVRYTGPMVEIIQKYGGYARIHCHGRIKNIMPYIVNMGANGIDPVEPPPHGDMELADIRREYGKDLVLFGNLEITDIENMEPEDFEKVAARSIRDGKSGEGKGFVLMPSASPYGRTISHKTMKNYEAMVRLAIEA